MKPMTPDRRAGLSVTGILLLLLAFALGAASVKFFGVPSWPLRDQEAPFLGSAGASALAGFICLLKGTEAASGVRK